MLTRCLTEEIHAEKFVVGRRPGALWRIFRVFVPVYDAIKLIRLLLMKKYDVYHINPSLDPRAVMRDALFLIILAIFRRDNVVVFFHGWDDKYYLHIAASRAHRFLFRVADT